MENGVRLYQGRTGEVTESERREALEQVNRTTTTLTSMGSSGLFLSLAEQLTVVASVYETQAVPRWKNSILQGAVLPYIQQMAGPRLSLDKQRFVQIQTLLHLLGPSSSQLGEPHPAITLAQIDLIVAEIKKERSLWPSKLGHSLEIAVMREWQPLLHDYRVFCHNIGGKAVLLGLAEVIGRPLIMLYPVYLLSMEIVRLASRLGVVFPPPQPYQHQHQHQHQHQQQGLGGLDWRKVSMSDVVSIVKLLAMCAAAYQALLVLSIYSGVGYSCLAVGFCALTLASSDDMLKRYIPALAPHVISFHGLLSKAMEIESGLLGSFSSSSSSPSAPSSSAAKYAGGGSPPRSSYPTSSRVEELHSPPSSPAPAAAASPNVFLPLPEGLRQRK